MELPSSADIIQLRVRKLEPGYILAKPVHSANGTRLLPKGTILNGRDISRLQDWKMQAVYVYDPEDEENTDRPYAEVS